MSDWFKSAFDESPRIVPPVHKSNQTNGKNFKQSILPKSLKRSSNNDVLHTILMVNFIVAFNLLIEKKLADFFSLFFFALTKKIDSIEPKSLDELAVSKQKLNELKCWLRNYFDKTTSNALKSPFLLLNGPSGSGKTISLKLLTKELEISFINLPTTSIFDDLNSNECLKEELMRDEIDTVMPLQIESQLKRFKRFLFDLNCKNTLHSVKNEKILVIEEIPSIFVMKPELLHEQLKYWHENRKSKSLVPIVFIISNSSNTENLEQKLLPKVILNNLNFQVITFKPITDFSLTKALNTLKMKLNLNKDDINDIIKASSGDIRHAINYLKFKFNNDNFNNHKSSLLNNVKKPRYPKDKKLRNNNDNGNNKLNKIDFARNDTLTISHCIAKILYAKRLNTPDDNIIDFIKKFPNCDINYLRNPLKENEPEELFDRINLTIEHGIDWLHENYLDFIHDSNDLNRCINCLTVLSDSALTFDTFYEEKKTSMLDNNRTALLTRGLMFYLNSDRSCYDNFFNESTSSKEMNGQNQFRSLRSPKTFYRDKDIANNIANVNELSKLLKLTAINKNCFILDILPIISQYLNEFLPDSIMNNYGSIIKFINYLVNFQSIGHCSLSKIKVIYTNKKNLLANFLNFLPSYFYSFHLKLPTTMIVQR